MASEPRLSNQSKERNRNPCKICRKTVDKTSWNAISDGTRGWLHEGCEEQYLELLVQRAIKRKNRRKHAVV